MAKKKDEGFEYQHGGVRELWGKRYVWIINHKGNLELHGLHHKSSGDE